MQDKVATEVKQPAPEQMHEEVKEKEKRRLALLMELAKVYYDGP